MDETGWRLDQMKAWLWITATDRLAVFTIARSRGSEVVRQVLGDAFGGVVSCDRWTAYVFLARRQLCWVHLLRDLTARIERFSSPWHGQQLVTCAREAMSTAYADRQAGTMSHHEMVQRLEPGRERMRRVLTWTMASAPGHQAPRPSSPRA